MEGSENWKIETRIALSPDDMQMVYAVRGAVFLAENNWAAIATFAGEFDAKDFTATHFITFVNGDPAGIMRVRWFRDFCVMERIGIRARYRRQDVFNNLAHSAVQHAREKGYTHIAGRAIDKTWMLWHKVFKAVRSGPPLDIDRGRLWPMLITVAPLEKSLTNLTFGDPKVEALIVQQEGEWDFELLRRHQESAA